MKRRTNITINEAIYAKAQELMQVTDFDDFSGFVEQLVRDEWERRHGPAFLVRDAPSPGEQAAGVTLQHAAAAAQGKPVSYRAGKAKRAKTAQSPQS